LELYSPDEAFIAIMLSTLKLANSLGDFTPGHIKFAPLNIKVYTFSFNIMQGMTSG